ncbi:protein sel-1 homolog 1-like [Oppia nitens]|uniref:protein sel-1 homolog 1-like n=1 Tax=Oppia nitens TaxID=1686743 RepID=UPI0023DBB98E|nr:protein sel-1 homolog 1-like [Oppia nitens]
MCQSMNRRQDNHQISSKTFPNDRVYRKSNDLYEKALKLLKKSDKSNNKNAYNFLKKSAELKHPLASEMLAKEHLFANNLPFDPKVALMYLQNIAINQSSSAHLYQGFIYSSGLGVKADPKKALIHYKLAANLNHPLAKMAIAFRFMYGFGVVINCTTALDLYHSVATDVVDESQISGGSLLQERHLWDESEISAKILNKDIVEVYRHLAKKGDISAIVSLGLLYYYGEYGVPRDVDRAVQYFQRAAKSGNANALAFLGKIHLKGSHSVRQNLTKALHLFQMSAQFGNPIAQTELGLMYKYGLGVDINFEDSIGYFSLSSRQGWVEGMLNLGLMYINGLGVLRDYRIAVRYLTLTLKSKHLLSNYNIGQLYAGGHGVAKSCPTAVSYFKSVAERGVISQLLTQANHDFDNHKFLQALIAYAFLSELGYECAQSNSAFIIENYDIDQLNIKDGHKRYSLALKYWAQSAAQGLSYARIKVGDYHYYGLSSGINYQMSAYYYRKASESQYSSQALFNLGYMFEKGLGVNQDYSVALIYYEMSARINTDARIAVFFAKQKVKFLQTIDKIMVALDVSKYFGKKWDVWLIFILFIVLAFVAYIKWKFN